MRAASSALRWVCGASNFLRSRRRPVAQPEPGGQSRQERRFNHRLRVNYEGALFGPGRAIAVRGLDIHRDGAGVISKQPFAPGSVVFVHLKSFRLRGFAHVRHCTPQDASSYLLGLEFRSPLMREEAGNWQFHRISNSDSGWSREWEASLAPADN